VGYCRMTDYRAEWKAGDNVQFRPGLEGVGNDLIDRKNDRSWLNP
jgi:hypothetical protein